MNKFILGLKNVAIAFRNEADDGWDAPLKLAGAMRFAPSPSGEAKDYYGDDGVYFTFADNDGYTGEIEHYNYPNDVLSRIYGWETDSNGALIETRDSQPEPFALMGEIEGEKKNVKFVYYNCLAQRYSKENITRGESSDITGVAIPLKMRPFEVSGKSLIKTTLELSDSNATVFGTFLDSVYQPTFA